MRCLRNRDARRENAAQQPGGSNPLTSTHYLDDSSDGLFHSWFIG
jgi:hypothetical protein